MRIALPCGMPLLCTLACGCAGFWSYGRVAREAERLVEEADGAVQAERRDRLRRSRADEDVVASVGREELVRRQLAERFPNLAAIPLADALSLATACNREYEAERDSNVSSALSLVQARHAFDPQLSGSLSALLGSSRADASSPTEESQTYTGSLGVEHKTSWGTQISADISTSASRGDSAEPDSTSVSVSVSQPLLKGAGRLVNRESLTQAERGMIYRLRSFERFRQSFAVRTTRQYYDLVRQRQVVGNTRRTFEKADFLYRRAQALFKIGRVPEIDVFQAEEQRLQAENNLRDAEESYQDSLLGFKTFLGVPDDVAMDIAPGERPPFRKVEMEVKTAIRLAYRNRLDLATERDRVEDAERALRIARLGLLPDLSLSLSASTSGTYGPELASLDNHSASAGLTLTLPLDRLGERVSLRRAAISLEAQKRQYTLFRDSLASEVRRLLRNLKRIEQSAAIQRKIVIAAEKRLKVAEVRFRQGRLPSRDVVEAQDDLLRAQNTLVQYTVDYAIGELEFRRAVGLLRVDPRGRPLPEGAEYREPRARARPSGERKAPSPPPEAEAPGPEDRGARGGKEAGR